MTTSPKGFTQIANTDPPNGPSQINAAELFVENLIGETVATASALPTSGNWTGRHIWVIAEARDYIWNGTAWQTEDVVVWTNLTLLTGWTALSGHTPRACHIGRVIYVEGAAVRGAGGALDAIATLPAAVRPTGTKTFFYGASVAARASSTSQPSSLYVDLSTGNIKVLGYTDIDSQTGWNVPLSGSFPDDMS